VAIRTSAAREILPLIDALRGGPAVEREAAAARLTVIGERGVPHLLDLLGDAQAPTAAHVAALTVLETVSDTRALDAALLRLTDARPEIACAAAGVVRMWLSSAAGDRALDRLTELALDGTRDTRLRLAALAALADLPARTRAPVWQALAGDGDAQIRAFVSAGTAPDDRPEAAAAPPLTGDPDAIRRWIDRHGTTASLQAMHRLLETVRAREADEPPGAGRLPWTATRAEVHQVLAVRGSRVALYDLRETIEGAREGLAPAFLEAADRIGDATLLEALARVYVDVTGEDWWRDRVSATGRAIVAREKLTARHTVMKRVRTRYPAAYEAFTRR